MRLLGVLGTNEIVILLVIFGGLLLIPFILFLVTQQNTLKAIQPQNRSMQPGEVWLQLIPLFGMVWQFIVVTKIADSIQRELASEASFSFEQQNPSYEYNPYLPKPTYGIGLAYCILGCCSLIPVIGGLPALAALVCWIIYWVQLSEQKNKIQMRNYHRSYSQSKPQY